MVALVDAAGPFFSTRQEALPEATESDWRRAERLDPRAFGPDGAWNLPFRCFAIRRRSGKIMIVDTGVGPEGSPASSWAPVPGRLPEELSAAGIDPADVDTVVLTHLHGDHVGWAVDYPNVVPMFANARYVIQRAEIAALQAGGGEALLRDVVEPLRRTGRLHEIDGRSRLLSDGGTLTAIPTPGHTPGHQSVIVEGGRRQIVVTGDVLVHAVQLVAPEVGYRYEDDQDIARETRRSLLARARDDRALLATCHLTDPFVPADAGSDSWRSADPARRAWSNLHRAE